MHGSFANQFDLQYPTPHLGAQFNVPLHNQIHGFETCPFFYEYPCDNLKFLVYKDEKS